MKPSLLWIIASIVFHSVSADYGEFPFLFLSPLSSRNLKKKDRKEKKKVFFKVPPSLPHRASLHCGFVLPWRPAFPVCPRGPLIRVFSLFLYIISFGFSVLSPVFVCVCLGKLSANQML